MNGKVLMIAGRAMIFIGSFIIGWEIGEKLGERWFGQSESEEEIEKILKSVNANNEMMAKLIIKTNEAIKDYE